MANGIIDDLLRLGVRAVITRNILRSFEGFGGAGFLSNLIGGLFGGGGTFRPGVSLGAGLGSQAHSGGIVGQSGILRSLRGGLRHDEQIVIAQKGEEILPSYHPRHRYNVGDQINALSTMISRAPRFHEGGIVGGPRRSMGGMPPVTINVTNNSRSNTSARIEDQRFDMDGYVVEVVIEDLGRNGPISQALALSSRRVA